MYRHVIIAGAALCLAAGNVLVVAEAAEQQCGQVEGRILDLQKGIPVVEAQLWLEGTAYVATTDSTGHFVFERVAPGEYKLVVTHPSYELLTVEGVRVEPGRTLFIKQKMTELPVPEEKPEAQTKPVQKSTAVPGQGGELFIRGGRANEVAFILGQAPSHSSSSIMPLPHGGSATVNNAPYPAMFFKHYGVNPFVDTEDDHLSTFAVDVDDASFTLVRRYLEDGNLPPTEAVRVEEFINHFGYDYTPPEEAAFRVFIEGAPSRFGGKNTWLLRIGIKGRQLAAEQRRSANLVFVIDVSSSMEWSNRLELVKKSLRLLLNELTPEDRVGIVVYDSRGRVVLPPTSIRQRARIQAAIDALEAGGPTYAAEGIRLGYEMADRMFDPQKNNRIILCSDGVANVGTTGPEDILKQIKRYTEKGITLSAIGFGMGNFNDVLMEKLGDKGNGHYAYVDNLGQARRIFVDNLTGTLEVIARDVKVQVDFDPSVVRSYRLLGYENRDVPDEKFRDDREDGGEIGSGHAVTALYELKLHKEAFGRSLGTVYIRYKHPQTMAVAEVRYPISHRDFVGEFEAASASFRLAAAVAEFAEILRESYWARGSDLRAVAEVLEQVDGEMCDPEILRLLKLVYRARDLQNTRAEQ